MLKRSVVAVVVLLGVPFVALRVRGDDDTKKPEISSVARLMHEWTYPLEPLEYGRQRPFPFRGSDWLGWDNAYVRTLITDHPYSTVWGYYRERTGISPEFSLGSRFAGSNKQGAFITHVDLSRKGLQSALLMRREKSVTVSVTISRTENDSQTFIVVMVSGS